MLRLALRRPLITALIAVLVFAGTMASATLLKTNFLESFADKTTLQVTQELPVGTRLSATSDAAKQVEAILDANPDVKEYLTTIGQGGQQPGLNVRQPDQRGCVRRRRCPSWRRRSPS